MDWIRLTGSPFLAFKWAPSPADSKQEFWHKVRLSNTVVDYRGLHPSVLLAVCWDQLAKLQAVRPRRIVKHFNIRNHNKILKVKNRLANNLLLFYLFIYFLQKVFDLHLPRLIANKLVIHKAHELLCLRQHASSSLFFFMFTVKPNGSVLWPRKLTRKKSFTSSQDIYIRGL